MRKTFLFTALLLATSYLFSAHAQIRKIPSEVTNAFSEKYGDAKNVEWSDNLSTFTASFEQDGHKYKAQYNKKGEWKGAEKELTIEDLSSTVKDGFNKSKYADWKVKSVTQVESPGDKIQYRVHVIKSDLKQKNLTFNEKGKLVKDSSTL